MRVMTSKKFWALSVFSACLLILGACSERAGMGVDGTLGTGDSAGSDTSGNDVGDGTNAGSQGGSDGVNGSEDGSNENRPRSTPCAEVVQVADPARAPVDIIWSIDTSGSMNQEVEIIEERMNFFAEFIGESYLDYRVIVIGNSRNPDPTANDSTYDICIGPPLSGNNTCPDEDSDTYRHVRYYVHSDDGLGAIISQYPEYQDFLRPDASVHMVAVSDDESTLSAADFMQDLAALTNPGFPNGIMFHSIVSDHYPDDELVVIPGLIELPAGCSGPYGDAEAYGEQYVTLSAETGGVFREICSAEWDDIFIAIGEQVLASSTLPCTYNIPEPSDGLAIVYEDVVISFEQEGGQTVELDYVESAAGCAAGNGWYYDDPANPTTIELCEGICGDVAGTLQIGFGCIKG